MRMEIKNEVIVSFKDIKNEKSIVILQIISFRIFIDDNVYKYFNIVKSILIY